MESEKRLYTFQYTRGALAAQDQEGLQPLDAFPSFERAYKSTELFPLFQNRVPNPKRGDYVDFVNRLGLTVEAANPFEILAISGGGRQTDNLEVFPKIQKRRDGTFSVRFFLHGWRHVNMDSQKRLSRLNEGDPLQVAVEVNNPVTGAAVQLETADDYHMIGWAPRYLIKDMRARAVPWGYSCARMQAQSASRSLQPEGPGRVGGPSAGERGTDVGT